MNALPENCVKIERKPIMAEVNKLKETPAGVVMDNGGYSVVRRVK